MKIGLFGTGAYGMAISSILIENKCEVTMWTKFKEEQENLQQTRKNEKLLPNFKLDESIKITTDIEECTKDKDLLIIAIPAAFVDSLCQGMAPFINKNHIVIATKGIEQKTGFFMHEILQKHLNTTNIAVISGPSFAIDIIKKLPIGLSLASKKEETSLLVKKALQNDYVKLRETKDITGLEICGAIKNVVALAAGMLEGLKANESTKAMLITEAIYDMEEILETFDCDKRTVISFAGIGDLLLTCTSNKSRNYTYGKLIGENPGKTVLDKYLKETTIEGFYTLESIYQLLKDKNVKIPIINMIYEITVKGKNPELLLDFLVSKS